MTRYRMIIKDTGGNTVYGVFVDETVEDYVMGKVSKGKGFNLTGLNGGMVCHGEFVKAHLFIFEPSSALDELLLTIVGQ